MSNKLTFNEAVTRNMRKLEQFVPVVARVHGPHHPEFHQVREVFDTVNKKVKEAKENIPELHEEFSNLREISGNYTVPGDVCESYEAVYQMLAELDEAYQA